MARGGDSFETEALDFRVEMMLKGILAPLGAAAWLGMALSLITFDVEVVRALTASAFALILVLVIACGYMAWSGWLRPALWTCAAGCAVAGPLLTIASQGAIPPAWSSLAGLAAVLLVGPAAGLAATAVAAGLLAAAGAARPDFVPASQLILAPALSLALVYLGGTAARVLLRNMRLINAGLETALAQVEQLRNQSAESGLALKSLNQTSFALARANEQLEIMVKFAEEARKSKQEFAANISHELRTPLNLIIGFSEVILYAPATYYAERLPPKLLADIHTIYRNAQHLLKLVNDILDLSQMDVSYMTVAREPMRIEEVVRSALVDFEPLLKARGLWLTVDVDPDLPELLADRTRIRQVLLNLLNNALRFTDSGGITVRATADAGAAASDNRLAPSVIFSVSDTGAGIAEADLERIFEPFTQLDSSPSRKHGGSGLGLTISKRFVELHGGRMWVESKVGQGSVFRFSIPPAPPVPLSSAQLTPQATMRREIGPLAVVERSPLVTRLLSRYLTGISVVHVATLDELSALAETICPEAIVVNDPLGEAGSAGTWPESLRHVPVLRCRAAGPLSPLEDRQPAGGEAAERLVVSLLKPVMRERLYAILAEMTLRAPPNGHAEPAPRPFRMLVVEDDEDALRLFGRLLRLAPADVRGPFSAFVPVEQHRGEDAIAFLRTADGQAIDGALLDIRLGSSTGFDVLREIERHEALLRVPVCLTTGGDMTDQPLITPFVTLSKSDGLTASELLHATAALMQVALPGVSVSVSVTTTAT